MSTSFLGRPWRLQDCLSSTDPDRENVNIKALQTLNPDEQIESWNHLIDPRMRIGSLRMAAQAHLLRPAYCHM
jgi:hypothetical protein